MTKEEGLLADTVVELVTTAATGEDAFASGARSATGVNSAKSGAADMG
jgi:hypothetical protein